MKKAKLFLLAVAVAGAFTISSCAAGGGEQKTDEAPKTEEPAKVKDEEKELNSDSAFHDPDAVGYLLDARTGNKA